MSSLLSTPSPHQLSMPSLHPFQTCYEDYINVYVDKEGAIGDIVFGKVKRREKVKMNYLHSTLFLHQQMLLFCQGISLLDMKTVGIFRCFSY